MAKELDQMNNTWKDIESYNILVTNFKQQVDNATANLIDNCECFGCAFCDENGTCPEERCALRNHCQAISSQHLSGLSKGKVISDEDIDKAADELLDYPDKRKPYIWGNSRNKWKKLGSDKFSRKGYTSAGRWVDKLWDEFDNALGKLPVLPQGWHNINFAEKYRALGSVVSSQTASYYSVVLVPPEHVPGTAEGVTVARLWVISPWHAVLDIVPDLLEDVKKLSTALEPIRLGTINPDASKPDKHVKQMEMPEVIEDNLKKKHKPCTHRIKIRTPKAIVEMAKLLRNKYSF